MGLKGKTRIVRTTDYDDRLAPVVPMSTTSLMFAQSWRNNTCRDQCTTMSVDWCKKQQTEHLVSYSQISCCGHCIWAANQVSTQANRINNSSRVFPPSRGYRVAWKKATNFDEKMVLTTYQTPPKNAFCKCISRKSICRFWGSSWTRQHHCLAKPKKMEIITDKYEAGSIAEISPLQRFLPVRIGRATTDWRFGWHVHVPVFEWSSRWGFRFISWHKTLSRIIRGVKDRQLFPLLCSKNEWKFWHISYTSRRVTRFLQRQCIHLLRWQWGCWLQQCTLCLSRLTGVSWLILSTSYRRTDT
jgi:hypothetical protein